MKRLLIAAAAALALASAGAMTACAPIEPPFSTAQTTMDEKGMFALESAYNVAATAYLAAVDTGALTGARKDQARQYLQNAYGALGNARTAYAIGNAANFNAHAAYVISSTRQASDLIQPK